MPHLESKVKKLQFGYLKINNLKYEKKNKKMKLKGKKLKKKIKGEKL